MQRRLLRLLGEHPSDLAFVTGVAARSRLGACTLTVRPLRGVEVDLDAPGAWLGRQPGVDLVVPKGPFLHVRLETEALRSWFGEGWREVSPASTLKPPPIAIALPEEDSSGSLGWARKAAVARAVAALLKEEGHPVEIETSADEHVWLRGTEASAGTGEALRVDVAEVDTRHDRMRARHGGILTLEDLRGDIREDLITLEGQKRSDQYADTLVSYLMTQAPRERRLGLDDQMVREKQAELDELISTAEMAKEKTDEETTSKLSAAAEPTLRSLIGEIESMADVRFRVQESLDPAPVNRLLRSLSHEMRTAEDDLPAGDPLWTASLETLESALRLAAPGVG